LQYPSPRAAASALLPPSPHPLSLPLPLLKAPHVLADPRREVLDGGALGCKEEHAVLRDDAPQVRDVHDDGPRARLDARRHEGGAALGQGRQVPREHARAVEDGVDGGLEEFATSLLVNLEELEAAPPAPFAFPPGYRGGRGGRERV